jgi:2-succinyl-5-enolpyruvyl-6-hydroxy-3-cyclohexene-1-carboxylate synthase
MPTARIGARTSPPAETEIERLEACVRSIERGVVCAGTLDATPEDAEAIARFATRAGWPVLADPLSQLRCGAHVETAPIVSSSELLLRSEAFGAAAAPDVAVRLGGAPVSKAQKLWLATHPPGALWLVDEAGRWEEPNHLVTEHVPAAPAALLAAVEARLAQSGFARGLDAPWPAAWREADEAGARALEQAGCEAGAPLVESDVTRALADVTPEGATVFLSNSMPIRDVDAFWPASTRRVRFLGNRGANGIDGIPSSALGVAAASEAPVVLLTGDLALLHDVGGLLAAPSAAGSLTIVVLDNDGGGIFSFLPIADRVEPGAFETLFRTPHGRDLRRLGAFFDVPVSDASDEETLRKALAESIGAPGVRVLRVVIDRDLNVERFRAASRAVQAVAANAAGGFGS